jgi:hypothetical protein
MPTNQNPAVFRKAIKTIELHKNQSVVAFEGA